MANKPSGVVSMTPFLNCNSVVSSRAHTMLGRGYACAVHVNSALSETFTTFCGGSIVTESGTVCVCVCVCVRVCVNV